MDRCTRTQPLSHRALTNRPGRRFCWLQCTCSADSFVRGSTSQRRSQSSSSLLTARRGRCLARAPHRLRAMPPHTDRVTRRSNLLCDGCRFRLRTGLLHNSGSFNTARGRDVQIGSNPAHSLVFPYVAMSRFSAIAKQNLVEPAPPRSPTSLPGRVRPSCPIIQRLPVGALMMGLGHLRPETGVRH